MNKLEQTIKSIVPVDMGLKDKIWTHLNSLTKPQGSLGKLEEIAAQYCLIKKTHTPSLEKKMIFTFAGDHGVAEEGVSAFPKEVTPQMALNMLSGGAAINVLARHAGIEVKVVDIGVDDPLENAPGLIRKKIRQGADNIARGPAMNTKEVIGALEVGIELAQDACKEGVDLIGTGEMGIANTTPASAIFATLLGCSVEDVTGRGTGIKETVLLRKINIIKQAIDINRKQLSTPLNILASLGGLEIAGICGLILGAASCRIPIVVDGFISSAGAYVAYKMCKPVKEYLFFSHCSSEFGHRKFLDSFKAYPILDLGMRLGEGTGAALAMPIIEAAVKIYNEMASFNTAGVSGEKE